MTHWVIILGSVRFFRFQAYKTKTEPVGFLKILISFFYGSVFSIIFFWFSQFNQFFNFFLTPNFILSQMMNHSSATTHFYYLCCIFPCLHYLVIFPFLTSYLTCFLLIISLFGQLAIYIYIYIGQTIILNLYMRIKIKYFKF